MSTIKTFIKYGKEWRKCSRCGKTYEATKENFSPQKIKQANGETWYGLRPECKECRRVQGRIAWHNKKGHYSSNSAVANKSSGMGLL